MKPSATFLNIDVKQFDKRCNDASHEQQGEMDGTATVIDPEEKVITKYVASHFVKVSGIPHAQIILSIEK